MRIELANVQERLLPIPGAKRVHYYYNRVNKKTVWDSTLYAEDRFIFIIDAFSLLVWTFYIWQVCALMMPCRCSSTLHNLIFSKLVVQKGFATDRPSQCSI